MFIINYIKQWKEHRRRKSILKDIKKAKDIYLRHRCDYMCHCFCRVSCRKYWTSDKIQERIPEFNREFLKAKLSCTCRAWWKRTDRNSRIEAFDKLIEIYSKI